MNKIVLMEEKILTSIADALNTQAFNARGVSLSYFIDSYKKAQRRIFQRILQSLFREKLLSSDEFIKDGLCYYIKIDDHGKIVFPSVTFHSMSSIILNGDITYIQKNNERIKLESPSKFLFLIKNRLLIAIDDDRLINLCDELDNCLLNDIICLAYHDKWSEDLNGVNIFELSPEKNNRIILLEQWGCMGHPWHPNYKTKLGLTAREVISLSPEFNTKILIRLCAVYKKSMHIEYMQPEMDYAKWWKINFPNIYEEFNQGLTEMGLNYKKYIPVPVHPWQFDHEISILFKDEVESGAIIMMNKPTFMASPGMSFRTVYPEGRECSSLIKMPVSIRLTSAQRTVTPRAAQMGPRVSLFLQRILSHDKALAKYLTIVPERIGGHYISSSDSLSRHLSFIIRDNPSSLVADDEYVIPAGCLFAETKKNTPFIIQLINCNHDLSVKENVINFFRSYAQVALTGILGIYLKYGVAFEAHQQNSFIVIDKHKKIKSFLIRDFGDIRINKNYLTIYGDDIKQYDESMTFIKDINHIREKLIHNIYMCHLGEIILLLSRYYHIDEFHFWTVLAQITLDCFDNYKVFMKFSDWHREKKAITEKDWPLKSFMRMRLQETITDIVMEIKNPLKQFVTVK